MLKKFTPLLLCMTFIISLLSACESANPTGGTGAGIKVSVSFDAIKEFVQAVGGDKAEITVIVPNGTEPHDFELKAKDLAALGQARIFVYNGLGMEPWAAEAVSAVGNGNLIVVEASKNAVPIENPDPHENLNENGHRQSEPHDHGLYDPHLWLSLKGAAHEANNIKDALIQADPDNAAYYEQNYSDFAARLDALFNEYDEKFRALTKKNFVTGHAAFGYLCREFGLEQNSVENTFADGEPTAKQLSAFVEYCRKNEVTTIFAEETASPNMSRTLADEVGAKVETIYTIESAVEGNMTYLQRMEENLSKIYDSLK